MQSKLEDVDTKGNSPLIWICLVLLLLGIFASVVGYVGCFSVVQSSSSSTGPLIWLCLEASLSVIRIILWSSNPESDDAPPLQLTFKLDHRAPLPTCNKYDDEIKEEKVLPLVRASQFLETIASFAGLVERFDHPDLTLYYTLTRTKVSNTLRTGKRVLYITIFDHKERTTRVYEQDSGGKEHFYSAKSDVLDINLEIGWVGTKLGNEIDAGDDPVASIPEVQTMLATHYRSIMDQIHFSIGKEANLGRRYAIENNWTLGMRETASTEKGSGNATAGDRERIIEKGKFVELNGQDSPSKLDHPYLEHGRLERKRRSLFRTRGKWIEDYMKWLTRETTGRLRETRVPGMNADRTRVGGAGSQEIANKEGEDRDETKLKKMEADEVEQFKVDDFEHEQLLIEERSEMEMLLVDEVQNWEMRLLENLRTLQRDEMLEIRLAREWRTYCFLRLDAERCAMMVRMEAAKPMFAQRMLDVKKNAVDVDWLEEVWKSAADEVRNEWDSVIGKLANRSTFMSPPSIPPLEHRLEASLSRKSKDMRTRFRPIHKPEFREQVQKRREGMER